MAAEDARFAKDVRRKVDRALREVDHLQISAAAAGLTAATALLNAWQSRRDRELDAQEGAISAEALRDAIHLEDLVHEDHIVIHATMGSGQAAPVPGPADEHRPGTAPSPPALSSAHRDCTESRDQRSSAIRT